MSEQALVPLSPPMKRAASEPQCSKATELHPKGPPPLMRRFTFSHSGIDYDPQDILEFATTLPTTAQLGLGYFIKPLMRKATLEMEETDVDIYEAPAHKVSFDEDMESDEESTSKEVAFLPLQPSVANFKVMLEQRYTRNLIISICHAVIGSFLSGFNTSLLNVPATLIQYECHLSITVFSSLQSVYCVGGLFGALIAGYFADRFGRKLTLLIANLLFMLSGIIAVLYTFSIFGPMDVPDVSFVYFSVSRGISGIASGISTAIIPTYLGEIAPIILRGEIGTYNALINAFGILFAEIIGFEKIFGNSKLWECIFLINILLPLLQLFSLNTFSKSPQWLQSHKNRAYRRQAKEVLQYLRDSSRVDLDINAIKSAKVFHRRKTVEFNHKWMRQRSIRKRTGSRSYASLSYKDTAKLKMDAIDENNYGSVDSIDAEIKREKNKYDRVVLIYIFFISIFLQILQQFSGINSVWYYSSLMLQNAGLQSNLELWIGNIMIAASNFFGVFIPAQLIEKLGRKKLMYLSCIGMIIASICLSVSLSYGKNSAYAGYSSIVLLILYVVSFATGLGPITGLLVVEVAPTAKRGKIMSIAFTFNYLANLFIAQYSNIVVMKYYYYPFAAVCFVGIIFTYMMVPETKKKRFEEIQHELRQKATKYF